MHMKRFVQAALVAGVLGVGLVGPASAAQTEPGEPGTKNCRGQEIAFFAQTGQFANVPGIGNLARYVGLSAREYVETADEFCAYIEE